MEELPEGEMILEKAGQFGKFGFKDGDLIKITKLDSKHFRILKIG